MLRDEIYEVYENMGPDEAARKRMLKNIRSAALQKEFAQKEKTRRMKKGCKYVSSSCGGGGGRVPIDRYGRLCSLLFRTERYGNRQRKGA